MKTESQMEKDYRLIRGAVIISLLPRWVIAFYGFFCFTCLIFALRIFTSSPCTSSVYQSGHDLNPIIGLLFSVWQLIKMVVSYAYFGCS